MSALKFDVLDLIREPDNYTSGERARAAEFIAAAVVQRNELLEALEPFASATLTHAGQVIGLMREDFERAIAAIAKATGEPA